MGTWRTFDISLADQAAMARRRAVVEEALHHGVNLFDSSSMYGSAEAVLARSLEGQRQQAIIATKVWSSSVSAGRQQIEQALAYYGRVEIYQVHNLVQWREYLPILHKLRRDGLVDAVGVTHYAHFAFPELRSLWRIGR